MKPWRITRDGRELFVHTPLVLCSLADHCVRGDCLRSAPHSVRLIGLELTVHWLSAKSALSAGSRPPGHTTDSDG